MTDQNQSRPLTRREMRLREMEATGAIPVPAESDLAARAAEAGPNAAAADAASSLLIEISPFDESGRQRSRREIRELRAQAEAELAAAQGATTEAAPAADAFVPAPTSEEPLAETVAFDVLLDQAQASAETAASAESIEFAPEAAVAPTQEDPLNAYLASLGDDGSTFTGGVAVAGAEAGAPVAAGPASGNAADSAAEAVAVDSLFEALAEIEVPSGGLSDSDLFASPIAAAPLAEPAPPIAPVAPAAAVPPPVAAQPVPPAADLSASVVSEPAVTEPVAPVHEVAPEQQYSFPDITPLDEGQSVFDDPALRVMGAGSSAQPRATDNGGFDDLINRAVAQEGATATTNTSALILPSFPETDGLAGPLGETGELYITGSIDLPKSLGETGGHSYLHDSVEVEPIDELGFAEPKPTGGIMAPVSASRAVSARVVQGPLVTEASKDKSKLPVVLIATGGVLVVGAVGLIIWAAASGLFG